MKYIQNFNTFESVTSNDVINFLSDFSYLITLNFIKCESYAIDEKSRNGLSEMMKTLRQPIINGKKITDLTDPTITSKKELFNPKFLSAVLNQVRILLNFIKPRIDKFVKDCDIKQDWLNKISKLEEKYKNIIQ